MTGEEMQALTIWYRQEFQRRTRALKNGNANIDWLVPEYRVSRIEVAAYAEKIGIHVGVQDWIDLFHHINDRKECLHA